MFTKQQLDDMWQNMPYGEFSRLKKNAKGKKKYNVTCVMTKSAEVSRTSIEVYAKDASAAIDSVSYSLKQKLMRENGATSWQDCMFKFHTNVV